MSIQETIERYQNTVVQIATKSGTGTGFYLLDYDLIVTNHHVVGDNQNVTIKGRTFNKMLAKVVFSDEKYDLAFLLPPLDMKQLPELKLGDYETLHDGDLVIAIGHPYGLNYTATQGVISRVDRVQQGIKYIQIDAAINPGNSGGPLINVQGRVVGVNTFIIKGGDNLGFALPVSYLHDALEQYKAMRGAVAIRCPSCGTLVTEQMLDNGKYCPVCGTKIEFPKNTDTDNEATTDIARTVEEILEILGHNKELARNGQNRWEVQSGSARIRISYNPDNYFIICDAYLCKLPRQKVKELYVYLLRENNNLHGMLFSVHNENIIISSLIYDIDINAERGAAIFKNLFEKADYYDTVLIEQFGCLPILEEQ